MKLEKDRIFLFVNIDNQKEVLEFISNKSLELGISSDSIFEELMMREDEYSTAMGHHIAIPHAKSPKINKASILFIRLLDSIDWRDQQVNTCIAILSSGKDSNDHLEMLSQIARKLMHEEFRERINQATSNEQVIEIFDKVKE